MTKEDYQKIDELNKILEKDPTNIKALIRKGYIFYDGTENHEAEKAFEQAIKIDPKCTDAYFWLAKCLWNYCEYEKAIVVAKKGLEIDSNRADLHEMIVWALGSLKQYNDEFLYHVKKVIELEPTWITPKADLIRGLIARKEFDLAKKEIDETFRHIKLIPVPSDVMEKHYEGLVTGRSRDNWKEKLENYLKIIENKK